MRFTNPNFTPWNDISRPVNEKQWADERAKVLAVLLAELPRIEDMKLRQEVISDIAEKVISTFHS